MMVYVLLCDYHDSISVEGVYKNEEQANAACKILNEKYFGYYYVSEYALQ